jgi:hypothetical protein
MRKASRIVWLASFAIGVALLVAGAPAPLRAQVEKTKGKWSDVITFPNVPIHTHVLPCGKVLFWGRRAWKDGKPVDNSPNGLTEKETSAFLWDPQAKTDAFTALPKPGYNMFCSGHAFLPDGRLLVVGGHTADQAGVKNATIFDPGTMKKWLPTADMNAGRWYPTAVTLTDGSVLVLFGTDELKQSNKQLQVWKNDKWTNNTKFDDVVYYPRMHIVPDGRAFMTGPLNLTQFLDVGKSQWTPLGNRVTGQGANALMEYAPSVLYNEGKILYIGGGQPPSNSVRMIDVTQPKPAWQDASTMSFKRRQHNATILPDGSVLVTGGTQGSGGPNNGFNDLSKGQPVHTPELWVPGNGGKGAWSKMADECKDRCYHSTAILLPDGRVLSGGGGEFFPTANTPNDLNDSHPDAQIFSPPYLFQGGTRLEITSAPDQVTYKATFDVVATNPDSVSQVNWIRLSSVTHSFNTGQRINFLKFKSDGKKLTVQAPDSAAVCPPGHYMLFVLDAAKVPSIAKIINIQ